MSIEFNNFEGSPLGKALMEMVSGNRRLIEFEAFSREGFPAVTAIVTEASKILDDYGVVETRERNFVKQCIGDFVGRVMKTDHIKTGSRSVPGKLFSTGALWTPKEKE